MTDSSRQHTRYAHEVAVHVRFGTKATEGRTRNVSRGGLSANVGDAIAVGSDITIDITLVFDDDMQSEALTLPGRIVWCTMVDDAYQVGVAFKPLDAERAEFLQLFLKYLGEERAPKSPRIDNVDEKFG